jgi:predicted TIM-barrel fold metal-dependent hydrolase
MLKECTMADPLRIDAHLHLYPTKAAGLVEKQNYEIWEYGAKHDVAFEPLAGDIEDAQNAMGAAGFSHVVVANLFAIALLDEETRSAGLTAQAEHLKASNQWACDVTAGHGGFSVFVAVDPTVLGGEAGAAHLRDMVEQHGARGVKIHPAVQRFAPDEPQMLPIYQTCVDLGIPVLSHSGLMRDGSPYAEPNAFGNVLRGFPELNLVLAHLGGGAWRQTASFAKAFPQASFDLCEIIAWIGAPGAPSSAELAQLIIDVGPERVMMGTDFPWYGLAETVNQVMKLPLLSHDQKTAILGANASRVLKVPA